MKPDEITKVFEEIVAFYPKFESTDSAAFRWFEMLKGYELPQVIAAVRAHVASSRFSPTLSDLISKLGAKSTDAVYRAPPRTEREDYEEACAIIARGMAPIVFGRGDGRRIDAQPLRYCLQEGEISLNGKKMPRFILKIDFACRHLGDETVARRLRDLLRNIGLSKAAQTRSFADKYVELVDEMVATAKKYLNQEKQGWL